MNNTVEVTNISFIHLHSMDPYMARTPLNTELIDDKQDKSHQLHNYKLIILNPSQLLILPKTNFNE
jgi:hypothetical protein